MLRTTQHAKPTQSGRAPLVLNCAQLPPQMTMVTDVYGGSRGSAKLVPEPGYVTGVPPSGQRGSRNPGPLVMKLLAEDGLPADSRATYHRLPSAELGYRSLGVASWGYGHFVSTLCMSMQ